MHPEFRVVVSILACQEDLSARLLRREFSATTEMATRPRPLRCFSLEKNRVSETENTTEWSDSSSFLGEAAKGGSFLQALHRNLYRHAGVSLHVLQETISHKGAAEGCIWPEPQ